MADSNPSPSFPPKKFPQNNSSNRPQLNQEIKQQQQQSISPVLSSQLPYNIQYQHQQNHRSSNNDSFRFRNQQQHQQQQYVHRTTDQQSLVGQNQGNFFPQQNELPAENRRQQQYSENIDKRRISQGQRANNTKGNPSPGFQSSDEAPQFQFSSPKKPPGVLKSFKQDWGTSSVDQTLTFSPLNQQFSQLQQQNNEQIVSRQSQFHSNRQITHGRMNLLEGDQSRIPTKHDEDNTQKGQAQIDNQQQWQRNNIVGVRKQKKGIQKYDSQHQINNGYRHFHQQLQQQHQTRQNQQNSREQQQKQQQQQQFKQEQDSSINTTSGQFLQPQQPTEEQELPSFYILQQYKKFKKLKQKIKRTHASKKQLAAEAKLKAKENEELGKQPSAGSESLALQRSNSNISMLDSYIERDEKKERQIRRVSVFLQEKSNADPTALKKLVVRLYQELGRKVETNKSLKESIRQKNERISELRKEKGIEEVQSEQGEQLKDEEQSEVYFSEEGDDDSSESGGEKEKEEEQSVQQNAENISKVQEAQQIQNNPNQKGNQIKQNYELSPLARLIRRCSIPFKPEPLTKSATEPLMNFGSQMQEPIIEEEEEGMQAESEQVNPIDRKDIFNSEIGNENKGETIKNFRNLMEEKDQEKSLIDENRVAFSLQKSHSF